MKFALGFAAVLAIASAQLGQPARYNLKPTSQPLRPVAPAASRIAGSDASANIVRYENDIGPDGSYAYVLETDNGIAAQAQGTPRDFGGNPPVVPIVSTGSFGWTSPEGQPISITYIADENGYQPSGDALPTPPPIPNAILRSLEYLSKYAPKN